MIKYSRNYRGILAGTLLGSVGLAAHAQSNVTLYGVVDAGILYTSKTVNPATGQNAGHQLSLITGSLTPSLFGLKGTDDLGGGLSYQVTPATNVDAGVWYTSDGNDTNNHSILAASGVTYSLSKATLVYCQFAFADNHGKMTTGVSTNGALFGASGSTFGTTVGIRHLF